DIIMVVTITSWLKRRMNNTLWMWIHRTSYIAFVAIFFHAAQSGTDFDAPLVSAIAWSTAAALAIIGVTRLVWGRLPAWSAQRGFCLAARMSAKHPISHHDGGSNDVRSAGSRRRGSGTSGVEHPLDCGPSCNGTHRRCCRLYRWRGCERLA